MLIEVQTADGPKKANVCDYCRTVCIPPPQRFCSGRCARSFDERQRVKSINLTRVAVPPFYLTGARARGSEHSQMWIGIVGTDFIRVIRSFDRIEPKLSQWHISASIGGKFGTLSTRRPTDDEMHSVLTTLGDFGGRDRRWEEDNVGGENPHARHYWAVKGGAT